MGEGGVPCIVHVWREVVVLYLKQLLSLLAMRSSWICVENTTRIPV